MILVVDDQPENLDLVEAFLIPLGYSIIKASSGEEALEILSTHSIDLVLLDVILPGINGFDLCRKLKKEQIYLPVILITILGDRASRLRGIKCGADDLLSKPFDSIELKLKVKNILKIKSLYDGVENKYQEEKKLSELKNDLTSFIVHDLRNPLTSIIGYLELIALSHNLQEEELLDIEMAKISVKNIISMISDLLDTAKIENNQLELRQEVCRLDEIVLHIVKMSKLVYDSKAQRVITLFSEENTQIFVQRNLIERILQNLLSNAIRYSPEKSDILIECKNNENAKTITVSIFDRGIGIPLEFRKKIFDKFATVESKGTRMSGSIGLGLTFCKLAVELHGGEIWVEERPEGGSVFRFTLPICELPL